MEKHDDDADAGPAARERRGRDVTGTNASAKAGTLTSPEIFTREATRARVTACEITAFSIE